MIVSTVLTLVFIIIVGVYILQTVATLPPCLKFGDTIGSWHDINKSKGISTKDLEWINNHFINNVRENFLHFPNIWIPNNCSYRQFNNDTIHRSVHYTLKQRVEKNRTLDNRRIEIIFVGDSAMRSIVCDICKILSNIDKGGLCDAPISKLTSSQIHSVDYSKHLRISFVLFSKFQPRLFDRQLKYSITRYPYAIIFDTGAFDFTSIARIHTNDINGDKGSKKCAVSAIPNYKIGNVVNTSLWEINKLAIQYGVRLLYKNNYHNEQLGGDCMGKLFISLFDNSIFEIWDTKNISARLWQTQIKSALQSNGTYRHTTITKYQQNTTINQQLSQSLLNAIFFDTIRAPKSSYDEQWGLETLYTAVMVEPREHKALKFVLRNFLTNLDNRWNILIYHGTENKDFVLDVKEDLFNYKHRIKLKSLNVSNMNIDIYNRLVFSPEFYHNIPTEMFLIFQSDTMICSKSKNNIYDFMQYDYVGAPWSLNFSFIKKGFEVGNGGLSLRRKNKSLEIIEKCVKNKNYARLGNEDMVFSRACRRIDVHKPDAVHAQVFSVESVFNNHSFGIHKAWEYMTKTEYDQMKFNCPDIDILRGLSEF